MAVAVTNTALAVYDTEAVVTNNAATSTVADAAEVFTITPTRSGNRMVLTFVVGPTNGAVALSIAVGVNFAPAAAVKTLSVAQSTTETIVLSGRYWSATSTIVITATPASGKKLLTDHAFTMAAIETPF